MTHEKCYFCKEKKGRMLTLKTTEGDVQICFLCREIIDYFANERISRTNFRVRVA